MYSIFCVRILRQAQDERHIIKDTYMHKKLVVMAVIGISFAAAAINAAAKLESKESKEQVVEERLSDKEFEDRLTKLDAKNLDDVNELLGEVHDNKQNQHVKNSKTLAIARKAVAAGIRPNKLLRCKTLTVLRLLRSAISIDDVGTAGFLLDNGAHEKKKHLFAEACTCETTQWLFNRFGSRWINKIMDHGFGPEGMLHQVILLRRMEPALIPLYVAHGASLSLPGTDPLLLTLMRWAGRDGVKEKAQYLASYGVPLGVIMTASREAEKYKGMTIKQMLQAKRQELLIRRLDPMEDVQEQGKREFQQHIVDEIKRIDEIYSSAREQILQQEKEFALTSEYLSSTLHPDVMGIVGEYVDAYSKRRKEADEFCWEED
jgi:hypothetical protein